MLSVDQCIHYIDDDFIIAEKPSGIPSVPGLNPHFPHNMHRWLNNHFPPVYVVHRLDTFTSGLIIYARTKTAQSHLSRQFQQRRVSKTYIALLDGKLGAQAGEIDLPLSVDVNNKPKQRLNWLAGKRAITQFKRLEVINNKTWVKFTPITGRSHQLRIHAQLIGLPICGCRLYGKDELTASRLMLHAQSVSFDHPLTQQRVSFNSAQPLELYSSETD